MEEHSETERDEFLLGGRYMTNTSIMKTNTYGAVRSVYLRLT
jgi:hypothetical protein